MLPDTQNLFRVCSKQQNIQILTMSCSLIGNIDQTGKSFRLQPESKTFISCCISVSINTGTVCTSPTSICVTIIQLVLVATQGHHISVTFLTQISAAVSSSRCTRAVFCTSKTNIALEIHPPLSSRNHFCKEPCERHECGFCSGTSVQAAEQGCCQHL